MAEERVQRRLAAILAADAAPPVALNGLLATTYVVVHFFVLFAVPLLLLPRDAAWGGVLVVFVLLTPFFWALAHETLHGNFHSDPCLNRAVGRVLCVLFGSSHRVLQFGHLLHHRLSRSSFDRIEVYDPRVESRARAALVYYFRVLIGPYMAEIGGCVVALLPQPAIRRVLALLFKTKGRDTPVIAPMAERAYLARDRLREIRIDSVAALALTGFALWSYGPHWWMLVAALIGRGVVLSLNDNAAHYSTPLSEPNYALTLGLPRPFAGFMLNFNYHQAHHAAPRAPWNALPRLHAHAGDGVDGSWLAIICRQLKGPIPVDELPCHGPRHRYPHRPATASR